MNSNVVNKDVQPREKRLNLTEGKARIRTLLAASDVMIYNIDNSDVRLIRNYRNRLLQNRHMLDSPDDRSLCRKILRIFNLELRAREARAPHERFLDQELS